MNSRGRFGGIDHRHRTKSRRMRRRPNYQKAVTEVKSLAEIMTKSAAIANANCSSRRASPPGVPGMPCMSFILTLRKIWASPSVIGGASTGCTAGRLTFILAAAAPTTHKSSSGCITHPAVHRRTIRPRTKELEGRRRAEQRLELSPARLADPRRESDNFRTKRRRRKGRGRVWPGRTGRCSSGRPVAAGGMRRRRQTWSAVLRRGVGA